MWSCRGRYRPKRWPPDLVRGPLEPPRGLGSATGQCPRRLEIAARLAEYVGFGFGHRSSAGLCRSWVPLVVRKFNRGAATAPTPNGELAQPTADLPLVLANETNLFSGNLNLRRGEVLPGIYSDCVEIASADADWLGLAGGDRAVLRSASGSVEVDRDGGRPGPGRGCLSGRRAFGRRRRSSLRGRGRWPPGFAQAGKRFLDGLMGRCHPAAQGVVFLLVIVTSPMIWFWPNESTWAGSRPATDPTGSGPGEPCRRSLMD